MSAAGFLTFAAVSQDDAFLAAIDARCGGIAKGIAAGSCVLAALRPRSSNAGKSRGEGDVYPLSQGGFVQVSRAVKALCWIRRQQARLFTRQGESLALVRKIPFVIYANRLCLGNMHIHFTTPLVCRLEGRAQARERAHKSFWAGKFASALFFSPRSQAVAPTKVLAARHCGAHFAGAATSARNITPTPTFAAR
jgi:hypothetical protein